MTYIKLSLKNIKKSVKDYVMYFLTMFLIVTFIYAFIFIAISDDIISLAQNVKALTYVILSLSIFISFICAFMVSHAISFILNQRKKEIAIYLLLGMDRKNVCVLFFIENFILSIISLILGIITGNFLASILIKVIYNIFEIEYCFVISFSKIAMIITILLFFLIYTIAIKKAVSIIWKEKIISLLYDNRKNEKLENKDFKIIIFRLMTGFFALIFGIIFLYKTAVTQTNIAILFLAIAVFLLLLAIYQLYCVLPFLLMFMMTKNKKWYYKNTNLFLSGLLRRKFLTSGKVMAIVAVLLSVSLAAMLIGLIMGMGYKVNIKAEYPYDIAVAIDAKIKDFDEVIKFVEQDYQIKDTVSYYLYRDYKYNIDILALTDYNSLREQLGLDKKTLNSNSYIIHCDTPKYLDAIKNEIIQNKDIVLNGTTLHGNYIYTEPMEQYRMAGSNGYVLVVPDEIVKGLVTNKSRLVISLETEGKEELRDSLNRFIRNKWNPEIISPVNKNITMSISVKAWGIKNSLSGFITISFSGLYLCIIFIILSATLLSFEQLSSIDNSKKSYSVLSQLGVSRKEQKHLAFMESANLFFLPMILPIIFIIIMAISGQYFLSNYIISDKIVPISLAITLGVFTFFYLTYFMITNIIYQKNIFQG
ncbi:FtsX-like permease family protein [Tepidibacter thalassicus]|uniref:FtsX-like permease family protein n=1 Tax=Tepidibacter thalassicus DSM 15285 TaxID=1123350 RepID=A0A1M5RMI3_9FIRM|nr:FtsX-like permease family protein [Tepidibacter thalassicus]SHH27336.1 FtsX-like permease family protein [Tepidibacter thalassicus DSM 15285]